MWLIFECFILLMFVQNGYLFVWPNTIPIIGMFHNDNVESEMAFRLSVERVNTDKMVLPEYDLVANTVHVSRFDSFNASKTVCRQMEDGGIGAIIGPESSSILGVVSSIANSYTIPHLKVNWDYSNILSEYTINLYPDIKLFSGAIKDLIEDFEWGTFTILYENDEALLRLQEVLKSKTSLSAEGHVPFTAWQLPPGDDFRPLLKEIHQTSESHIILDCANDKIIQILYQAREVKMLEDYHSYILTSLDAHTLNFDGLSSSKTNFTILRLVDPLRHSVQAVIQDWAFEESRRGRYFTLTPQTLSTDAALIHDAVGLLATAFHGMSDNLTVSSLNCLLTERWSHGFSLIQYMKGIMSYEGLTGTIKFDPATGRRSFFTLEIIELMKNEFRKIAAWDPENHLSYTRTSSDMERELLQEISNSTFVVVSRIGKPYLMVKEGTQDEYEGYSKDLIHEISLILGFSYKFVVVKEYGSYDSNTRQWNGLIRELKDRRAHLAICDLTITSERRSAVDFSMPFMTLGISILFKKPAKPSSDLFSFLSPLSFGVWMCMATAYLGVSLVLFFLSRISPYEWDNPHPCKSEAEELECNFSLLNCMWLATGSLMQQGSDILPMSISTRIVAGVWWFFILIMISSYTANLAAFLTMERMDVTIESVADLAKQSKIKYGVLAGGSSSSFFRDSNESIYQKMWSVMEATRPSVFVSSNDEGVERVLKGNRLYAFFMESTSIEYQVEKNCELIQVGGTLDSKGYGIAMPNQFPYRSLISGAILNMQESGKLLELKNYWWREKHEKTSCSSQASQEPITSTNELTLFNVGGMFLVLIGGCGIAFFVSILEFLWNVQKVAVQERISPKQAFLLELKFALRCYGTTKPVRKLKSEEDFPALFSSDELFNQINSG